MELPRNGPQLAVFLDFENVATSAEANYGEFDVTAVLDLLRARGRLLIKRAYCDWARFHRYRRPMLENGIDLFQLYSVGMQQKNRADVRLAIDAVESVFTRPNIDVYAIISGDSDFTELIHKLRDHGKYTIGIGLRSATSDLLRRACDEFIFYETLITEELADISDELQLPDPRELLRRALSAAESKGETPVFAGRLKQIMLGLDSSFNEANYGFPQFRTFLEAHQDLASIQDEGLQLYVSLQKPSLTTAAEPPPPVKPSADLSQRYRSFLREANLRVIDVNTRRQVLTDFLMLVQAPSDKPYSLNQAADELKDCYDAHNTLTQKVVLPDIMRLLIMSDALTFAGGFASGEAPLVEVESLTVEDLAQGCDTVYVWRLIEGSVPVNPEQLAGVLFAPGAEAQRVASLCDALVKRKLIARAGDSYGVAPEHINDLIGRDELRLTAASLAKVRLPAGEPISPVTAENLFRVGSELRQKDFAGSAERYLQAARIQLDSLRSGHPRAGFDDLKWYLASYSSVKAGHAFVTGNYAEAIPHYLAFFGLAQESDSVWPKIQRLVNPMASYFFAIAGKELDETVPPNLGRSPACQVAFRIQNHENPQVEQAWDALVHKLANVNLGMIRQVHRDLSISIASGAQSRPDVLARMDRTRVSLAHLISEREAQVGDRTKLT